MSSVFLFGCLCWMIPSCLDFGYTFLQMTTFVLTARRSRAQMLESTDNLSSKLCVCMYLSTS